MTSHDNTATAGGVATPDTPGRPARPEDSERREHDAKSVLSLTSGAGPKQEDCMVPQRRQARPVRFDDPARNAAYWARIDRIVDAAPPLSDYQRAVIRTAFSQPRTSTASAPNTAPPAESREAA